MIDQYLLVNGICLIIFYLRCKYVFIFLHLQNIFSGYLLVIGIKIGWKAVK